MSSPYLRRNIGLLKFIGSSSLSKYSIQNPAIKNSQDYKRKLLEQTVQSWANLVKMASLDIVSLFSKFPVEDVLGFITWKIHQRVITVPILEAVFLSLLRPCTVGNVFEFEWNYFRQKFSKIPAMIGLHMEYFESKLLPKVSNNPTP